MPKCPGNTRPGTRTRKIKLWHMAADVGDMVDVIDDVLADVDWAEDILGDIADALEALKARLSNLHSTVLGSSDSEQIRPRTLQPPQNTSPSRSRLQTSQVSRVITARIQNSES